jgi:hypothetical protein
MSFGSDGWDKWMGAEGLDKLLLAEAFARGPGSHGCIEHGFAGRRRSHRSDEHEKLLFKIQPYPAPAVRDGYGTGKDKNGNTFCAQTENRTWDLCEQSALHLLLVKPLV